MAGKAPTRADPIGGAIIGAKAPEEMKSPHPLKVGSANAGLTTNEARIAADERAVTPLYVGPRNAEAMTGQKWRWVRDFARANDVPIISVSTRGDPKRGKSMIPVTPLVEAIERHREHVAPAESHEDELEKLRRALGKRKKLTR